MEVLEAIKSRRSIRRYQPTPVDEKAIELVLEAARWAPSWANTQCWRFIVVRNTSIKDKLAETLRSARPDGKNIATEAVRKAPVVIVACAELKKSGYYHGEPTTDKGDWYMFDVALAMQNLILAAHSIGLGTVHVGAFDAQEGAKILRVPSGIVVVEMTPVGIPQKEVTSPTPRKELSQFVYYDRYGSTSPD